MTQQPARPKLQDALALHEQGRLAEAAALYRAIIALDGTNPEALHLLGVVELQSGSTESSVSLIEKAVARDPGNALYRSNLGLALQRLGRLDEALMQLDHALGINPNSANALNHRANVLRSLGRPDQALAAYARALAINPAHADALNNRGGLLAELNRTTEAIASFDRALSVNPNHAGALSNRGATRLGMKQFDLALSDLERAVALDPGNPVARNNFGNALCGADRLEQAMREFDAALSLDPGYADALYNRGTVHRDLRRYDRALADVERVLSLQPGRADAMALKADCLQKLNRWTDALQCYDDALRVHPEHTELLIRRAHLRSETSRLDDALDDFNRAFAIDPGHELLRGWRAFCKLRMCQWSGIETEITAIGHAIKRGELACSPAVFLAMSSNPEALGACARSYAERYFPAAKGKGFPDRPQSERIHLGYFSADFHAHATAYLTAGLFEQHDRTRFRVSGFSFGPAADDSMRHRLQRGFDAFLDVSGTPDGDIVRMARNLGVDIAIDLKGYTEGSRTNLFRHRAAPIQVSYLGYPGTMGTSFIDYLIADDIVLPAEMSRYYNEKIATMPHCYQPNDSARGVPDSAVTRRQYGLPSDAFVFCCFNNNYKITSNVFDIWMRLLKRVEGSILWLFGENASSVRNLRAEAHARGVDPDRLVFANRVNQGEHLARHLLADLFLDTLPYGAHTTASDALWAGLPLLTCLGASFQGRVAASMLRTLDLPELITTDFNHYEEKAFEFASDAQKLRLVREKLRLNRNSHPLFDTASYTQHLEAAFLRMWELHNSGRAPEAFHVFAGEPPGSKSI